MRKRTKANSQAGFSLLELLITVTLLCIIMGALFSQINQAQQNATSQQTKLDLFQEAREFMDQMARDVRASAYPNTRNFSADPITGTETLDESPQEAMGLVKIDIGQLWLESSIDESLLDGSGTVSEIHYNLVTTGTGCPCLERSQTAKIQASPLSQNETDQVEVQNVLNGTTAADPIFRAYYAADGTAVSLPVTFADTGAPLAGVNTIDIILKVQSPTKDPITGQQPTMTLMTTVRLNNCTGAYPSTGTTLMGCK